MIDTGTVHFLTKEIADLSLKFLRDTAKRLGVIDLSNQLLDLKFQFWSGSSNPIYHHYGNYGLLIHTCEVTSTCLLMRKSYSQYDIDETELFLAALFHDAGKIYDYEKVKGVWGSTEHKRTIHHISRSAIIWNKYVALESTEFQERYEEKVTHAILAHHGQREWGSPVSPKTRVAWVLHLCDNLSARLYDADTRDRK